MSNCIPAVAGVKQVKTNQYVGVIFWNGTL